MAGVVRVKAAAAASRSLRTFVILTVGFDGCHMGVNYRHVNPHATSMLRAGEQHVFVDAIAVERTPAYRLGMLAVTLAHALGLLLDDRIVRVTLPLDVNGTVIDIAHDGPGGTAPERRGDGDGRNIGTQDHPLILPTRCRCRAGRGNSPRQSPGPSTRACWGSVA